MSIENISGAEIVLECLIEQGVETVFGYPGGSVIPLYDKLLNKTDKIRHFLTAHEQGAVHAADGYARSTGKTGVCFVTSGPGATNTVTGIATAYLDSVPLIVFTGQVSSSLLGKDSFQEVDITSITEPITKHNYIVEDTTKLADTIREAFRISQEGRKGPVLIDIPKNVFINHSEYSFKNAEHSTEKSKVDLNKEDLLKIVTYIRESKRPVIYAGGGVNSAEANKELFEFVEKTHIPVVNSLMGLGCFPRNHELSLGLVGMHGFSEANLAITESDLVLAFGARFSDRVTGNVQEFAKNAKIIQIDIDKSEIGKNKSVDFHVIADLKILLNELNKYIDKSERSDWIKDIQSYVKETKKDINAFVPSNILSTTNKFYDSDTIVVTDVGQHQMWVAQNWNFQHPKTFLTSGGLGTMGYGLGAAIGAKIANPGKNVVLVTGDGSFRMNNHELVTISRYGLNLTIILFNNQALGMVRQWQKLFHEERYSQTCMSNEVDYQKLVQAYGLETYKVDNLNDLTSVLDTVKQNTKTSFIECKICKDECVYPIVPPGKAINDLIHD